MPKSRLRKNRKKPYYTQTIVEPEFISVPAGLMGIDRELVSNPKFGTVTTITHKRNI